MSGVLYLVPAPIVEDDITHLPEATTRILQQVNLVFTEERKSTIRYIKKAAPGKVLQSINFIDLNEHTDPSEFQEMISLVQSGQDAALLSEAGLPCVADPGARLVALAHKAGIRVVPLTGPSSLFLALMSSGMNGQEFTFHGYLPKKPEDRNKKIRELEKDAVKTGYTQLFIETPYRNDNMFDSLVSVLQPETLLCIACEINNNTEFIRTMAIKDWKKNKPDIQKKNCVFLVARNY
jgi:16S rRNA (cytidine1402-2'-O)-methyltransferase